MQLSGFRDLGNKNKSRRTTQQSPSKYVYIIAGLATFSMTVLLVLVYMRSTSITQVTNEIAELNARLDAINRSKLTLSSQIDSLVGETDNIKKDTKRNQDEASDLEKEEKRLRKEIEQNEEEFQEMNSRLKDKSTQRDDLQDENERLNKQLKRYDVMDKATYKSLKSELESKIESLELKLSSLKSSDKDEGEFSTKPDSEIIYKSNAREILRHMLNGGGNVYYRLLYRMSRDGRNPQTFHQRCQHIKNDGNVVIIRDREGSVFGGYTTNNWDIGRFKPDTRAFLFNIENEIVYRIHDVNNAIYSEDNYLAVFGEGDIVVSETGSYSDFPRSYGGSVREFELTNGKREFDIAEMEVFEVKFD